MDWCGGLLLDVLWDTGKYLCFRCRWETNDSLSIVISPKSWTPFFFLFPAVSFVWSPRLIARRPAARAHARRWLSPRGMQICGDFVISQTINLHQNVIASAAETSQTRQLVAGLVRYFARGMHLHRSVAWARRPRLDLRNRWRVSMRCDCATVSLRSIHQMRPSPDTPLVFRLIRGTISRVSKLNISRYKCL